MKIRDKETPEQAEYRRNLIITEETSAVPVIAILAVLGMLAAFMLGFTGIRSSEASKNVGNPYNCSSCKTLGRACKEHKEFNSTEALKDKIHNVVEIYDVSLDDDTVKNMLYPYYGYNNICDFCNEQKSECYSCSHDRLVIQDMYNTILESGELTSYLCSACQINGVPNCDICKTAMANKIFESLRGN